MKLAIGLSHMEAVLGPELKGLLLLASEIDDAGADQIVMSDHVALPATMDGYPGSSSGAFPFPPEELYPEPLVTLAAIAAVTKRARLSTNVLVATLRPAVLLAKLVATLDMFSGGRLDLGVGTGWLQEEFDAIGVPLEGKARRLDDTIGACRALWTGGPSDFSSPTVSFSQMHCRPTPRNGTVPIWYGGAANAAMARRVVNRGDGWTTSSATTVAEVAEGAALIQEECDRIGRDPASITIRVTPRAPRGSSIEDWLDAAGQFAAAGATMVQFPLLTYVSTAEEGVEMVTRLVTEVHHLEEPVA